jgi:hypothetical protein
VLVLTPSFHTGDNQENMTTIDYFYYSYHWVSLSMEQRVKMMPNTQFSYPFRALQHKIQERSLGISNATLLV